MVVSTQYIIWNREISPMPVATKLSSLLPLNGPRTSATKMEAANRDIKVIVRTYRNQSSHRN